MNVCTIQNPEKQEEVVEKVHNISYIDRKYRHIEYVPGTK